MSDFIDMSNFTDEQLMLKYQDGDEGSFRELFSRWNKRIYGYLNSNVYNANERDDLFQAIFLKLHKSRGLYDPKFPFAPWMFTICKSVVLDFARKKQVSTTELNEEIVENLADNMSQTESYPVLQGALEGLSPLQKQVIELRYIENMSFDEISKRVNKSPVNVRQLVSRALKLIRGNSKGGQNE